MTVDREDLSSLVVSASLIFLGGLLNAFAKLIERVIVGRWLSPDAYGEVSIGLAILTFSVTLSLIGFNQGIPRYVSTFDDERDVRGTWVAGLAIAGGLSLLLAVVLLLNVDVVAGLLFEDAQSLRLLRVFAATIPFVVGLRVGIGGIRGLENTVYKTYVNDLLYPGLRLVALVGLLQVGAGLMAPGYAYLIAAGTAFVAAHLFLNRLVSLLGTVRTHSRELVSFSLPLVISTIISVLLTQADTLMLGYFRSSFEVAQYSAAYPLANGLLVILSSVGYIYLPMASRLDAEDKREEVTDIYRMTCKWVYVVTFPGFLAFVAFPGDVVSIVFGEDYRAGGFALAILALGFFTNAAAGRNRETLAALGYPRGVLYSNVAAFGLNIAMNLVLIPRYGFPGAAVASASSYVLLNVVVYALLKRRCGITPFSRYTRRTFAALPALLIVPVVVLSRWVSLSAVTLPVFLVASGGACLVLVWLAGGLQPEDRLLLEGLEDRFGVTVPYVGRFLPDATRPDS